MKELREDRHGRRVVEELVSLPPAGGERAQDVVDSSTCVVDPVKRTERVALAWRTSLARERGQHDSQDEVVGIAVHKLGQSSSNVLELIHVL